MKINPLNIISFVKNVGIQQSNDGNSSSNNAYQSNINQNSQTNNNFNFNKEVKFNNLNLYQQIMLIKELLKMPQDWLELMNWTLGKTNNLTNLKQIILLAGEEIDLQKLILLIQSNSKEAIAKLLKLTSPSPENFQNTSQLKELMSLLVKITPDNNTPINQLFTNIIPFYVPLTFPMQNLETLKEFEELTNPEKTKDLALLAYLTTEKLGRIKIYVYKKSSNIDCLIENDYKNSKTVKYIEKLVEKIQKEANISNIQIESKELKVKHDEKREIFIKQLISPACDVINTTFIVVKAIFALDEKISLLDTRKEKI